MCKTCHQCFLLVFSALLCWVPDQASQAPVCECCGPGPSVYDRAFCYRRAEGGVVVREGCVMGEGC